MSSGPPPKSASLREGMISHANQLEEIGKRLIAMALAMKEDCKEKKEKDD